MKLSLTRRERSARRILKEAREGIAERNDDKELASPQEALLLRRVGAKNIRTMQQVGGSWRLDLTYGGVNFVTVTKRRMRGMGGRNFSRARRRWRRSFFN